MCERFRIDIGRKELQWKREGALLQELKPADRQGIDFFARGASWNPDSKGLLGGSALDECRKGQASERLKDLLVTKKASHMDQKILVECFHFGMVLTQIGGVIGYLVEVHHGHAVVQAPPEGGWLVGEKIDTCPGAQQPEDAGEMLFFLRIRLR